MANAMFAERMPKSPSQGTSGISRIGLKRRKRNECINLARIPFAVLACSSGRLLSLGLGDSDRWQVAGDCHAGDEIY
jgi:hypothetical protein